MKDCSVSGPDFTCDSLTLAGVTGELIVEYHFFLNGCMPFPIIAREKGLLLNFLAIVIETLGRYILDHRQT